MTVKNLLSKLNEMPLEAEVYSLVRGKLINETKFVWLSQQEQVLLSDGHLVLDIKNLPKYAADELLNTDEALVWVPK